MDFLSSDLNHPDFSAFVSVSFFSESGDGLDDVVVILSDDIRFKSGLAFGVDNRLRVEMSVTCECFFLYFSNF